MEKYYIKRKIKYHASTGVIKEIIGEMNKTNYNKIMFKLYSLMKYCILKFTHVINGVYIT